VKTSRSEAFSDGVIAIIITIMVLSLRKPAGTELESLRPVLPELLTYVLSFVYLGIYWNNHHHMLLVTRSVNGAILWANLHLLFWLSLIPFVTGWLAESHGAPWPIRAVRRRVAGRGDLLHRAAGADHPAPRQRLAARSRTRARSRPRTSHRGCP